MPNTRSNLVAARIYEVDEDGKSKGGGLTVACMFNPFEYTVTKSNTYEEKPKNDADTPQTEFKKSGAQTLESGSDLRQLRKRRRHHPGDQ